MPNARHSLMLIGVIVAALGLLAVSAGTRSRAPAQWPRDDAVFRVEGWSMGDEQVQIDEHDENRAVLLQRTYTDAAGEYAEFVMWTTAQPQAKQLFRKGPDRDFLGAGYTVENAPQGLVQPVPGGGATIARQGPRAWLLIYMFGERRGALGSGLLAWTAAETDAVLDRPNNYFLARVAVPFGATQAPPSAAASQLAGSVFPRLSDWYAHLDA